MRVPLLSRTRSCSRSERGFSLVEVAISASILAVVSVGAVVFFRGTMKSMDESAQTARVLNVASSGLAHLERDFAHSTPDRIWIEPIGACYDDLRMQVPVGFDSSGPVWGAMSARPIEVNGEEVQHHPNWKVRYHVEGTILLRDLVNEAGEFVPGTATVIARDLLPYEAASSANHGGTAQPKIFRLWQPDPVGAKRIYAGVLTTAVPVIDGNGTAILGPWKEHRTTLRAEKN